MAAIFIRKAQYNDNATLIRLAEELHYLHTPATFDRSWKEHWLNNFLTQSGNLALLALSEQIPVGYLFAETRQEEYDRKEFLYIREIYLAEAFRGYGGGTQLIEKAIQFGKKIKCKYLLLNVRAGNSAIQFFSKHKFNVYSTELNRSL